MLTISDIHMHRNPVICIFHILDTNKIQQIKVHSYSKVDKSTTSSNELTPSFYFLRKVSLPTRSLGRHILNK